MREVGADLERQQNSSRWCRTSWPDFTIKAPAPGMVIYVKEWNGKKKASGRR